MAPLIRKDVFEAVVLVGRDGQVIYGGDHPSLSAVSLDNIMGETKKDSIITPGKGGFSSLIDTTLAGMEYKLFLQPLDISFVDLKKIYTGEAKNLAEATCRPCLCGLIQTKAYNGDTRAIPYFWLFLLILYRCLGTSAARSHTSFSVAGRGCPTTASRRVRCLLTTSG